MTLWEIIQLISVLLSPIFAAGGAYGATRVRLAIHEKRLDALDINLNRANMRIDGIVDRSDRRIHFVDKLK